MDPAISLIAIAVVLGTTSGLSPGPLLALVVAESFQRGFRSGAAVAIAPIITDLPIVLLMMALANALSSMNYVIGSLYLAGSGCLVYLSVEIFRIKGVAVDATSSIRASFREGFPYIILSRLINVLS